MVTVIDNSLIRLKDFNIMSEENSGYMEKSFEMVCALGDTVTKTRVSFPFLVSLLSGKLHKRNIVDFDRAKAYLQVKANNGVVGAVSAVSDGDTVISLLAALPFYLFPGCKIVFDSDGAEYEVMSHDEVSNQITLSSPVSKVGGYTIGEFIVARFYNIDIVLFADEDLNFAENSFGSKLVLPEMELVIEYYHNVAVAVQKSIYFMLRYYHGDVEV